MLKTTCIFVISVLSSFSPLSTAMLNLSLPGQHPNPDAVVQEFHRRVNVSLSRRQLQSTTTTDQSATTCLTGNPIDDCWRCDPNWQLNRQRLADCAIGFGQYALGGKGGRFYVVTDSSDNDAVNPRLGTLRYAVVQSEPLWIVFSASMTVRLSQELIFNSFKTVDGRGANVHVTGGGCITLQYISNVIIHNIHVHNCYSSGNANVRSSPTHYGFRSKSDGDGISIFGSRDLWIDHCSLWECNDGLIDAVMGSTGITVSNSYFARHNEVMLLGHSDDYLPDSGMQVTIAFNHFGEKLVQRMPRCRLGYIHVVNNDFTQWEMYAIGGSGNPTINSQGNRYIAPTDHNAKEVTKRVETDEEKWSDWNWRSEGDIMVNGAFFVASGAAVEIEYEKAYSVDPKSAEFIDQITLNAGVLGSRSAFLSEEHCRMMLREPSPCSAYVGFGGKIPRNCDGDSQNITGQSNKLGKWTAAGNDSDSGGGTILDSGGGRDYTGMVGSGAPSPPSRPDSTTVCILIILSSSLLLYVTAASL